MDLDGTTAIVTGAGSGLGRDIALGLAAAGSGVVIADLDPDRAEDTARGVRQFGVPGHAVAVDLRVTGEAYRLVRRGGEHGGPHILVNNAGGWTPGEQYPAAQPPDWGATMALNLTVPMLLSQLVLGPMRQLGGGAIVNIASSAGLGDDGYDSPEYAASKAGLIRFTSSLAGLERTHGVRMGCVVPGWIGLDRAHAELAVKSAQERAATPPLIPPADVVAVVLDLARNGPSGTVVELLRGDRPPRRR
jgi:NAD(P)-dependent dehydrogenase (short-subunit alcohol dehydrogenase family)